MVWVVGLPVSCVWSWVSVGQLVVVCSWGRSSVMAMGSPQLGHSPPRPILPCAAIWNSTRWPAWSPSRPIAARRVSSWDGAGKPMTRRINTNPAPARARSVLSQDELRKAGREEPGNRAAHRVRFLDSWVPEFDFLKIVRCATACSRDCSANVPLMFHFFAALRLCVRLHSVSRSNIETSDEGE